MKNELQQLEELASHECSLKVLTPFNKPESSYIDSNGNQVNVYKDRLFLHSHFNDFFSTPVQEAKQAINGTTKFMKTEKEKRLYINEILRILDNILEVNKRNCKFSMDLKCEVLHGWNDYHSGLFMKLINLKISLEKEYEPYIEKKVQKTFEEFDNCINHEFLDEHFTIYEKQHKPDCKCLLKAKENLNKIIFSSLSSFKEKYPTFAKNWIENQKELGHQKVEEDYISILLSKQRFDIDDKAGKVSAKNKKCTCCNKIFEFRLEFYDEYIKRYYNLQNDFLKERLEEIKPPISKPLQAKIKTSLSVPQLGYIFNLFNDKGVMRFNSKTENASFAADNFSSEKKENISKKQVRKKMYEISPEDIAELYDLFSEIGSELHSLKLKSKK